MAFAASRRKIKCGTISGINKKPRNRDALNKKNSTINVPVEILGLSNIEIASVKIDAKANEFIIHVLAHNKKCLVEFVNVRQSLMGVVRNNRQNLPVFADIPCE
jgi:hypothetical protein